MTTPEEIAALDRLGADAQVGMALYTGRLDLADAIAAPLRLATGPTACGPRWSATSAGGALGLA